MSLPQRRRPGRLELDKRRFPESRAIPRIVRLQHEFDYTAGPRSALQGEETFSYSIKCQRIRRGSRMGAETFGRCVGRSARQLGGLGRTEPATFQVNQNGASAFVPCFCGDVRRRRRSAAVESPKPPFYPKARGALERLDAYVIRCQRSRISPIRHPEASEAANEC